MANRIQLRRGGAQEWVNSNPTLAQGELGVELDTGRFKIGDGVSAWNSLRYSRPVEATTATANNNSDLPVQAKKVNRRLVRAINPPAKNIVLIVPALIAMTPPNNVKTIVVIQPSPLEYIAICPFENPISL